MDEELLIKYKTAMCKVEEYILFHYIILCVNTRWAEDGPNLRSCILC
jgi:hypothetical protein